MFPPQCRANLAHFGDVVHQELHRSSAGKQARTGLFRKNHYVKFCNWMQLEDPCMGDQPPEARNYFLACYAVSLVQGYTIKGISSKYSMLKQYTKGTYNVLAEHQVTQFLDPDYLAIVMKAHINYENVPKVES